MSKADRVLSSICESARDSDNIGTDATNGRAKSMSKSAAPKIGVTGVGSTGGSQLTPAHEEDHTQSFAGKMDATRSRSLDESSAVGHDTAGGMCGEFTHLRGGRCVGMNPVDVCSGENVVYDQHRKTCRSTVPGGGAVVGGGGTDTEDRLHGYKRLSNTVGGIGAGNFHVQYLRDVSVDHCLNACDLEKHTDLPRHIQTRCNRVVYDDYNRSCRMFDNTLVVHGQVYSESPNARFTTYHKEGS